MNNTLSNEKENLTVSQEIDKVFGQAELKLAPRESGEFRFQNIDVFLEQIDQAINFVKEYVFADDERKVVANARSLSRKVSAEIKTQLKETELLAFGQARSEQKVIEQKMGELDALLKERVNYFDNLFREERNGEILAEFDQVMIYKPEYQDYLDYDRILDPKWLNRSTTLKSAKESLHERFEAIETVDSLGLDSLDVVITTLPKQGWDVAKTIRAINEAKRLEAERAERIAQAEAERARKAEENLGVSQNPVTSVPEEEVEEKVVTYKTVRLKLPVEDMKTLRKLAMTNGWEIL